MKRLFALIFSLLSLSQIQAQDSLHVYSWHELEGINPHEVQAISLKRQRLKVLPEALAQYTNLIYLDLSSNRLDSLAPFLGELHQLRTLDLSKNRFQKFPSVLLDLKQLERLVLNRNGISVLPEEIVELQTLSYLDLWDNPLPYFPESFLEMPHLKELHVEGIKYGPIFQEKWRSALSWMTIYFDAPCDCRE